MPGFGGAGPGLSILMGVAQGVANADKRKREMEQEAIRNRLAQQQILESESRVSIAAQQENRLREGAQRAAEEAEYQREETARIAREQANQRRMSIASMAQEIMDAEPNMDPNDAFRAAELHVDQIYEWEDPAALAAKKAQGMSWSEREFWYKEQQRLAAEAALNRIRQNPTNRRAIQNALTLDDALAAGQQLGLDPAAVQLFWEESGSGEIARGQQVVPWESMPSYQRDDVDYDARMKAAEIYNRALTFRQNAPKVEDPNNPGRFLPQETADQTAARWLAEEKSRVLRDHEAGSLPLNSHQLAVLYRLQSQLEYLINKNRDDADKGGMFPGNISDIRNSVR